MALPPRCATPWWRAQAGGTLANVAAFAGLATLAGFAALADPAAFADFAALAIVAAPANLATLAIVGALGDLARVAWPGGRPASGRAGERASTPGNRGRTDEERGAAVESAASNPGGERGWPGNAGGGPL